jgi:GntR family transcriptional regulator/MocR family aminotransferase
VSEALFYLDPASSLSLQNQIRQKLVQCIMAGTFPAGARLPSSRKLAEQLGVARNTVVLAYEQLIGEGLLESRERSGIFVAGDVGMNNLGFLGPSANQTDLDSKWRARIRTEAGQRPRFQCPGDWQQHPYPFIDGQFDASLYPTAQWREASRMALGARIVREGSVSEGDADDPALVEEIRTKMLPRRGRRARQPADASITAAQAGQNHCAAGGRKRHGHKHSPGRGASRIRDTQPPGPHRGHHADPAATGPAEEGT